MKVLFFAGHLSCKRQYLFFSQFDLVDKRVAVRIPRNAANEKICLLWEVLLTHALPCIWAIGLHRQTPISQVESPSAKPTHSLEVSHATSSGLVAKFYIMSEIVSGPLLRRMVIVISFHRFAFHSRAFISYWECVRNHRWLNMTSKFKIYSEFWSQNIFPYTTSWLVTN